MASICAAVQPLAAQSHSVLIRAANVFDGVRSIGVRDVLVRGGLIVEVGTGISAPAGATIVDGSGQTLMPGMIDSHTHVWPGTLRTALVFGVTTELDMFLDVDSARAYRSAQRGAGIATRADVYSAGTLVTAPGGHGTQFGVAIPTITAPEQAQAFVDARIAEGSDYIKIVYDKGDTYGLRWSTLSRETLDAVIRAAHARGKLAVVHIGDLASAQEAIAAGADGLVHLFVDRAPDPALAELMASQKAFAVPTLSVLQSITALRGGAALAADAKLAPYLTRTDRTTLGQTFPPRPASGNSYEHAAATVRMLHAAGVRILAGTDAGNPGTAHGVSMHGELALLVAAGLTPSEALVAATSAPAEAFRLTDRGRIAVGLRADLLLVRGDPTRDITATRDISGVWKGGVYFDRASVAEAVAAAEAAASRLPAGAESGLVSDFDSGTMAVSFGAGWTVSEDKMSNGASSAITEVVRGGANGSSHALRIAGEISDKLPFAWAGAMFSPGATMMAPANLSSKRELRFWARGDGAIYRVMVFAESKGVMPMTQSFRSTSEWKEYVIPISAFAGIDGKDLMALLFVGGPRPGAFELFVDDVRFR
jgi:imidazolonepropionase-like amidohydrolase